MLQYAVAQVDRKIAISGRRVALGAIVDADAGFLSTSLGDRDVTRYLGVRDRSRGSTDMSSYVKELTSESNSRHFAILGLPEKGIMGVINLREIDWVNRHGILGYWLNPGFWGRGLITEAINLVLELSFGSMGLRKILSSAFAPNSASIRALKKTGFVECGRLQDHVYIEDHGYVDEIIFERFKQQAGS